MVSAFLSHPSSLYNQNLGGCDTINQRVHGFWHEVNGTTFEGHAQLGLVESIVILPSRPIQQNPPSQGTSLMEESISQWAGLEGPAI